MAFGVCRTLRWQAIPSLHLIFLLAKQWRTSLYSKPESALSIFNYLFSFSFNSAFRGLLCVSKFRFVWGLHAVLTVAVDHRACSNAVQCLLCTHRLDILGRQGSWPSVPVQRAWRRQVCLRDPWWEKQGNITRWVRQRRWQRQQM